MTQACRRGTFLAIAILSAAGTGGCGEAEKPAATPGPRPEVAPSRTPLVAPPKAADWCGEHGVPESICTRCNSALIADFKEKGDWCGKHGLPKSQCVDCDPALAEKLKALAPAPEGKR